MRLLHNIFTLKTLILTWFIRAKSRGEVNQLTCIQSLNRKWRRRGSQSNFSMIVWMNIFLSVLIRSLWTLIMHKSESLSSDIVDRSHVLARLSVLNGRSTVQVVAGRVSNMIIASRTAGNKSVFFTKSTQPYSFCLMDSFLFMSYHDIASCSKLSIW